MEQVLIILSAIIMLLIAAEDLRYRKIRVLWLALLNLMGFGLVITQNHWHAFGHSMLILIAILGMLAIYIRFRFGSGSAVFGWGDVWMLAILPAFLPPMILPVVIIASALISIVWASLHVFTGRSQKAKKVPYAGLLSLCLALITLINNQTDLML